MSNHTDKMARYNKLFISLRYWLVGMSQSDKKYIVPLKALEYAKNIHIGFRKDGNTPEFQHQLEITHFLRTLIPGMMYPSETLAAAILHDVPEDYDISFEDIESNFGSMVRDNTELLTKTYRGGKKNIALYFDDMSKSPIASIIKGADRINNQQSMHPVFTIEKQKSYLEETTTYIIPMLKKARHLHVEQEHIYENIKFVLNSQMALISQKIEAISTK